MTKEQKIQEAWGDDWETVKKYVNAKTGIADIPSTVNRAEYLKKYKFIATWPDVTGFKQSLIPEQLSGIETNNGWVKIESEEDLPNDDNLYWVIRSHSAYISIERSNGNGFGNYQGYKVTHFQPIEKPKPPIY
jgi:hypothetical protein